MRKIKINEKRDFKGVWIPKEIYLNENLSASEIILLAEIDSLDQGEGCYKGNKALAEFIGTSESALRKYLTNLRSLGLIYDKKFDGRKRFLGTNISKKNKSVAGSLRKFGQADCENLGTEYIQRENTESISPEASSGDEPGTLEKPFDCEEYINNMISSNQPHIRVIGIYYEGKRIGFPSKAAITADMKKWFKTATTLAEYPGSVINSAIKALEKMEKEGGITWTMAAMLKKVPEFYDPVRDSKEMSIAEWTRATKNAEKSQGDPKYLE